MVNTSNPERYSIRRNKSTALPRHIVFFDVETNEIKGEKFNKHTLRLGVAAYVRYNGKTGEYFTKWCEFTTDDEFFDFVIGKVGKRQHLYLIAHNIAFDFAVVDGFRQMKSRGFSLDFVYCNGTTVIAKYKNGSATIVLMDSLNIFKVPLRQLGETLGLPKLEINFNTCTHHELLIYCKRDVEILVKAFTDWFVFLRTHDLGRFGYTIASQAMHAFRHRFMSHPIIIHRDSAALELERRAYHGGRCSVFYHGKVENRTVYDLDINSAYPFVMLHHEYPCKLLFSSTRCSLQSLEKFLENRCVIADVTVKTPEPVYPYRLTNRTIFPVGTFRTYLTTEELRYALSKGHILKVHAANIYTKARLFVDYVNFFYNLKEQYSRDGNLTFRYMTKLFLNSLYGKFGQRKSSFVKITEDDNVLRDVDIIVSNPSKGTQFVYRWGEDVFIQKDEGESDVAFPAIAAHITANTRLYLWQLIKEAGIENVYYCDTDSIITNAIGYSNLYHYVDPYHLGYLKLEDTFPEAEFLAPKVYRLSQNWKRKGVPQNAEQVDENTFEYVDFPHFRSLGRFTEQGAYFTRNIRKVINPKIVGGYVTENRTVQPVYLYIPDTQPYCPYYD